MCRRHLCLTRFLCLPPTAFSPPSVHVSLQEERLLVKVQFPCAASRRCSLEGCCPVSRLIDPWTTVTVYNTHNQSDIQVLKAFRRRISSHRLCGLVVITSVCVSKKSNLICLQNKYLLLHFMLAKKGAKANVLDRVYMLVHLFFTQNMVTLVNVLFGTGTCGLTGQFYYFLRKKTTLCCALADPHSLEPGGGDLCGLFWLGSGSELLCCG